MLLHFSTVLMWQNSSCLPLLPPEHTEGLELLWGVWQAGNEGLVSGGLRRAAVAYVGKLYLAVRRVCIGAAQGVQAL